MERASPQEEAVEPGQSRWTAWFPRHRVITMGLLLYIAVDKASQMSSLLDVMCGPEPSGLFEEEVPASLNFQQPDLWQGTQVGPRLSPVTSLSLVSPARSLESASPNDGSSTNSASSDHTGHSSHPHEAMFFLISSLLIGCMLTHMMTMPLFEGMQQSVALFTVGLLYSLVQEGLHLADHLGVFGRSYNMWMEIDPHLLLFTLLPPLVTGDAMTIDTSVARRVAMQCMFLAGPGVAINGFATAGFLYVYLPYDWSFLLCLTTGAILCATDPVAVVALLKELGASPTLTVQIQGESLLNDGTAIVLYTIAYNMLKGETYDAGDIIQFLVKMAIYAWGLGVLIGFGFFCWIRGANNKLDPHRCSVIQMALTISCAYSSFIVAEGAFHISGVLATVASALILANRMWPQVVEKESMHTVWHMLEYLGNTLIFFLAGALTGKTMLRIQFSDYAHLLVIYLAATFLRGCLFFASRPLLSKLSPASAKQEVSVADCLVMTWGGLRGAIGLALAIQVQVDKAGDKVSQKDADRVLFYVSGIASLTLMINASTCPALVKWLGITQLPATKRKMLQIINRQLLVMSMESTESTAVRNEIRGMLEQVETNIGVTHGAGFRLDDQRVSKIDPECHMRASLNSVDEIKEGQTVSDLETKGMVEVPMRDPAMAQTCMVNLQAGHIIVHEVEEQKGLVRRMAPKDLFQLSELPALPLMEQEQQMYSLVSTYMTDPALQRAVNEAFLSMVRSQYWKMIEHGEFVSFSNEAEHLLTSVTLAFSQTHYDLNDWSFIEPFIRCDFEQSQGRLSTAIAATRTFVEEDRLTGCLRVISDIVESTTFFSIILACIMANTIYIYVEQESRDDSDTHIKWLITEIIFQVVFTVEFILKFAVMKMDYFKTAWNVFDFFLVILGTIGTVVSIVVQNLPEGSETLQGGSEAQLVRAAQIFRMMRIARLFRLLRFWQVVKAKVLRTHVYLEVAEHMQKTAILTSFIKAHIQSMELMVKYFGRRGEVDTVEVARCILQSQVEVYKSMLMLCSQRRALDVKDRRILEAAKIAQDSKVLAEELEAFVLEAHAGGVINHHEAESILVPIHEHVKEFIKTIGDTRNGKGCWEETYTYKQEQDFDLYSSSSPAVIKQLVKFGAEEVKDIEFGEIGNDVGRKSCGSTLTRSTLTSRRSTAKERLGSMAASIDEMARRPSLDSHEASASFASILKGARPKKSRDHVGFASDEDLPGEKQGLLDSDRRASGRGSQLPRTSRGGAHFDFSQVADAETIVGKEQSIGPVSSVRHPGRLGAFQVPALLSVDSAPAAPPPPSPSPTDPVIRIHSAPLKAPPSISKDTEMSPRSNEEPLSSASREAKPSFAKGESATSEPAQEPAPELWREGAGEEVHGNTNLELKKDRGSEFRFSRESAMASSASGSTPQNRPKKVIRKKRKKNNNQNPAQGYSILHETAGLEDSSQLGTHSVAVGSQEPGLILGLSSMPATDATAWPEGSGNHRISGSEESHRLLQETPQGQRETPSRRTNKGERTTKKASSALSITVTKSDDDNLSG